MPQVIGIAEPYYTRHERVWPYLRFRGRFCLKPYHSHPMVWVSMGRKKR